MTFISKYSCSCTSKRRNECAHQNVILDPHQVHPTVLSNVMRGQVWPGGTRYFHSNILTPTLVIHGESDPFVSLEEDEEMFKVQSGK